MRRISRLAMLGLVGATACSDTSGLAAKDACKENAVAYCERIVRCEGATGLSDIGYISAEDCALHMKAIICSGESGICSPGQTYHPDVAQACLIANRELECNSRSTPAVCEGVCTDSGSPLGGGTISYQDACKQMVKVICKKAFTCGSGSGLSTLTSQYDSEAECASGLQTDCSENSGCGSRGYHGDKASQCIAETAALSCSEFNRQPAVCEEVCGPSGSGGSGGSSGSGSAYQEFCKQVMNAYCNRCAVESGMSIQSCISSIQSQCENIQGTSMCPTGTLQPSKTQACLDAIETMSCTAPSVPACESGSLCN